MRADLLQLAHGAATHAPLILLALVGLVAAMGSVLPFSPVEPLVVLVAATSRRELLVPLIVTVTVAHMAAKALLFVGSGRATVLVPRRRQADVARTRALLERCSALRYVMLLGSATIGLPPFYAITIAAGALRLSLREFLVIGTLGRGARFAMLAIAPQLFAPTVPIHVPHAFAAHGAAGGGR